MPISLSTLMQPQEFDIPKLGAITIRPSTIADETEAVKQALGEGEPGKVAIAFANNLIATILVSPKLSVEQVANLPEETAASLIDAVIDVAGLREHYHATPVNDSSRQRLYDAHQARWAAAFKQFGAYVKGLRERLRPEQHLVTGLNFSRQMMETVSQSLTSSFSQMFKIQTKIADQFKAAPALDMSHLTGISQGLISYGVDDSLQDLLTSVRSQSLKDLVQVAWPPEPFLSNALIASDLNSSLIHRPMYPVPVLLRFELSDDIDRQADNARRHRRLGAYDTHSALEEKVRTVIEVGLRGLHGDQWWKRGVPATVREECERRKHVKEAVESSPRHHPIFYAYLGDYRAIIEKRDNWEGVFSRIFRSKVELQACFMWWQDVRDPVAHVRPINDDEYVYFTAAANWLMRAMERALAS